MFPLKPPFVGDCPSCHVWFPGAKPTVATGTQLLCPRDGAWMDFSSGPGGSGKIIDVASCFQVCLPRGKLKHCDGDLMWFTQVEHGLEAKSQTQSQTAGWKRNCLALGFCWKEQLRFVLQSFRKQMLMWVDALHKQARGLWILGWHHMFFFTFSMWSWTRRAHSPESGTISWPKWQFLRNLDATRKFKVKIRVPMH